MPIQSNRSVAMPKKIVVRYTSEERGQRYEPVESVPITQLIRNATQGENTDLRNASPEFKRMMRNRAHLGVIEHARYERFVNLYSTPESLRREETARRLMIVVIGAGIITVITAAVQFFA
ncbi:MAG: hypothetical protein E7K47_08900 [Acidovorax sp.]|nr:hypothetical protein [Acidovorax sp.]TFI47030.1 hypothetical protein E4O93_14755 [Diaphorobacter sp. DS2]